jgi:hypothetical protein
VHFGYLPFVEHGDKGMTASTPNNPIVFNPNAPDSRVVVATRGSEIVGVFIEVRR